MAAPRISTLLDIVAALPADLCQLHLTFVTTEGVQATFAQDNAHEFRTWAKTDSCAMALAEQA